MLFTLEFAYNLFNLYFTWFSLANFYLSFYFLFAAAKTNDLNVASAEKNGNPFGQSAPAVFYGLNGLYIGSIVAMFITAMGNRPQGTKWLYYLISTLFSMLMVGKFEDETRGNHQSVFQYVLAKPAFRDLVVSIVSTYGLYLITSVMHLDPWHIFTSMVQYLLVLPTYNNIFMIYAFCNLHDVRYDGGQTDGSWGTKGATTMEDNAPAIIKKGSDGKEEFEFEYSTEQDDVDNEWSQKKTLLASFVNNPVEENSAPDLKTKRDDDTKIFRTNIVLAWMFSNLLLCAFFTNDAMRHLLFTSDSAVNPYLTFLFWSVAFISAIRAVGSTCYMVQWVKERKEDMSYIPPRLLANV
ncbi:Chitin synthase, class 2 [Kappamyces sp. JEL0680]|nr:Chitin synthase, class 2 [Kappamyces sp. JEL0680]